MKKDYLKIILNLLKDLKNCILKGITRFSNYKNSKKWFVVYLIILTFCLACFSIVNAEGKGYRLLFSWKSSIIIDLSLIALFCWNLSISFKNWLTKLCSFREDEPLVDFTLLWIIASIFLGILDGANIAIAGGITQKIALNTYAIIAHGLLLVIGLCWSLYPFWKESRKNSRRTRIMNIIEDNHEKDEGHKPSQVTHLFNDLNNEQ